MAESYLSEYLPAKYKKRHQLMLYLSDILVDIILKADEFNLSSLDLKFTNKIVEDYDILDELNKQRDIELSEKIFIPHIYFSLLKDLNNYLYESLSCIERGKVTVGFTLARKPLQDNLFYLNWILVDSKDFLEKILYKETKDYDVSSIKGRKNHVVELFSKAKSIINPKGNFLNLNEELFNPELLYDVIYNRKARNSLTSAFDKSIHLITGNSNYPTEKQNLNFIFTDNDIWNDFLNLYYEKIPYIILWMVEVAIAIFENILEVPIETCEYNYYIRQLKAIVALTQGERVGEIENLFDLLFDNEHINMTCIECGNLFNFDFKLIDELKNDYLFTCQKCGEVDQLGQYFISDEVLSRPREVIIDNIEDGHWKLVEK